MTAEFPSIDREGPPAEPVTPTPEQRLVPVEPTLAMIIAYDELCNSLGLAQYANVRKVWPALLSAAPPAPTVGREEVARIIANGKLTTAALKKADAIRALLSSNGKGDQFADVGNMIPDHAHTAGVKVEDHADLITKLHWLADEITGFDGFYSNDDNGDPVYFREAFREAAEALSSQTQVVGEGGPETERRLREALTAIRDKPHADDRFGNRNEDWMRNVASTALADALPTGDAEGRGDQR